MRVTDSIAGGITTVRFKRHKAAVAPLKERFLGAAMDVGHEAPHVAREIARNAPQLARNSQERLIEVARDV
ncbi:MAG: hypothetical protein ACP5H2_02395, partial [Solirubrobacteraceae bacterium]